ncbi:hypothetical protein PF011_g17524 [Phytophthora fragariae]|uniref:DDE-1 domain-containing protein n=1 Tax=Phytophthora fragariae TaxID=53985 RepID=A0A6A3JD52_9STRA|nr:hypothetical protein PF011_g17524 [Phytophthora fragariae]
MKAQNRNILLLYDNALSHKEGEVELSNITTARLPKNTTVLLQPMDQGHMETIDTIEWINEAWNAMPERVLRNCWRHAELHTDRLLSVAHILN